MPVEKTKNYIRRRIINPNKCAKGSFRTITTSARTKRVICCPKGHYNKKTGKCRVGTISQSALTKR